MFKSHEATLAKCLTIGALSLAVIFESAPAFGQEPFASAEAQPVNTNQSQQGASEQDPEPDVVAGTFDEVVEQEVRENELSADIQDRIDAISEDTDAMASQYRASLQNTRQLKVYNRQLEDLIAAQEQEKISLRKQIDDVTVLSRGVLPHMQEMIATLEQFIELDMPFLIEERRRRVENLKDLMGRADVTISEKYRRIMESYQIENDYGRTIEAYRGELGPEGESRTVDYLRIGRIALLYQTLDGQESGVWNGQTEEWSSAPEYRIAVREGLRMARKQRAPELIQVPLPAAEEVH